MWEWDKYFLHDFTLYLTIMLYSGCFPSLKLYAQHEKTQPKRRLSLAHSAKFRWTVTWSSWGPRSSWGGFEFGTGHWSRAWQGLGNFYSLSVQLCVCLQSCFFLQLWRRNSLVFERDQVFETSWRRKSLYFTKNRKTLLMLVAEKHQNLRGGDKLGWKGKGPPFNSGLSGFIKTRWQEPESSKVKFLHFFPKARLLSLCRTEMISIAFHILRSNFYLIFFAYDIEKYLWFCVWFHDMH